MDQSLVTSAATDARPLLVIIATDGADQNREFFRKHKITCPVLLQKESEVATAYQITGTPAGYLVSAEGKIASELAIGADALLALANEPRGRRAEEAQSELGNAGSEPREHQSLLTSAPTDDGRARATRFSNRSLARSRIKRDGLKAGTPAPDFRLPRLDGRGELSLEDLRGRRVLLVFSSPHCGPCNTLATELERFHRENGMASRSPSPGPSPPGEGEQSRALEVVMISRGEPGENRAKMKEHGLTFPVLLQQQWEISRRYAMFATPIACLIDEAGMIVHDVAVGTDAILDLVARADRLLDSTPELTSSGCRTS
jgi:peroxiredoxin